MHEDVQIKFELGSDFLSCLHGRCLVGLYKQLLISSFVSRNSRHVSWICDGLQTEILALIIEALGFERGGESKKWCLCFDLMYERERGREGRNGEGRDQLGFAIKGRFLSIILESNLV